MRRSIRLVTAVAVLALSQVVAIASRAGSPADPLSSVVWNDMVAKFFPGQRLAFDDRVKVVLPTIVENQAQVPVTADARALGPVEKLIVFADLNPIQHVLTLKPTNAEAYVSFRMKVEQATPVRAAALTADGVWHVGGAFLDAAGGGCSAPAVARKDADWSQTVGMAQGRLWRDAGGAARVRLRVRHPMDTGLAKDNTPAYFIEKLEMKAGGGKVLAGLELFEPVSEDPTLTLLLRMAPAETALDVEGRDNNGMTYRSSIPAPWKQSALSPDAASR